MRKWHPRRARRWCIKHGSNTKTVLSDWYLFVRRNENLSRSNLILAYVGQQLEDGLDPSTIGSRLRVMRSLGFPVRKMEFAKAKACITTRAVIDYLARLKNSIGTRRKELRGLSALRQVYEAAPRSERDLWFMRAWFMLVATGQRLGNLVDAQLVLESCGVRVFYLNGRKTERKGLRAGIFYSYEWSEYPPPHLNLHEGQTIRLTNIGDKSNAAARMNLWLKNGGWGFTSGQPRVRLDNVLRVLLEKHLLTESEYCRLIDHNLSTSDQHYMAI